MDYFSLCFHVFCLVTQGAMHLWFCHSLTRKKRRAWHFAAYIFLLHLLDWFAGKFSLPWFAAIGAELLILYGINRQVLGNGLSASWLAAVLANYLFQLSFGLVNPVEALWFPYVMGTPFLYLLILAAALLSFAICAACYATVVKSISPEQISQMEYAACLLTPVLFFFAAELYIIQTSYTQASYNPLSFVFLLKNTGRHTGLLFLQTLGLGSLFSTLYAYRRLCHTLRDQANMQSLT